MTAPAILLLGATSEIGGELATRLCRGKRVVLGARRVDALKSLERRLLAAGAVGVEKRYFDATDTAHHRDIVESAGPISEAIVAFGILGDQERAETDEVHAFEIAAVDYASQVVALTVLSDAMLAQHTPGTIVAFSSIAGWRARRANYVYGSTKAGLDAFCQGLSDRLHGSHVKLITARPGFVIGNMTKGMKPAPMSVDAATVADTVAHAVRSKKSSATVWIPRQLEVLAWVMRLVPRRIWRHMPR